MTILIVLLIFCAVFAYTLACGLLIEAIASYWNRRYIWRNAVRRLSE